MRIGNFLTLSTSPKAHPAKKPRSFANLSLQRRSIYGRERRCHTGKELDAETGLYYYGARYMDPKTSRWLSGDPALGEYVPSAPVNEEAKKRNGSLPGMGGVFNYANLHVYHYAGNNPVKYTDPDGRDYNDDGTYTVEEGDTLWGIYGADWQEKSGYTGDPTKLQIGEVVGRKDNKNNLIELTNPSELIDQTESTEISEKGKNRLIGGAFTFGGIALAALSLYGMSRDPSNGKLAMGFKIGLQITMLGLLQVGTGDDILGPPIDFLKTLFIDEKVDAVRSFNEYRKREGK